MVLLHKMISPNNNDFHINYPWINKSLFEKLIRKQHENDEITVEHFSLAPALMKGENYASQMIRAEVKYVIDKNVMEKINFVIKAQIINAPECFGQNDLFSREIAVFQNVIPRAEALLKKIGDDTKFSAK